MKRYEIIAIRRERGNVGEKDTERIGKQYFTAGFTIGRPALLHHEDVEGRVLVTSFVQSVKEEEDVVELETENTRYILREIQVH